MYNSGLSKRIERIVMNVRSWRIFQTQDSILYSHRSVVQVAIYFNLTFKMMDPSITIIVLQLVYKYN